ncbi:MAG TPA: hypothetical protein VIG69_07840 [Candidatus Methylomirabilis sp.]|jgi:hypothetical protein
MQETLVQHGGAMDHAAVRAEVETAREPLILVGRPRHRSRLAPSPIAGGARHEIIRCRNGAMARLAPADCGWLVRCVLTPEVAGTPTSA